MFATSGYDAPCLLLVALLSPASPHRLVLSGFINMPCEVVRWLLAAGASLEHRNAEGVPQHPASAALCRAGCNAFYSSVLACGHSMQPNFWRSVALLSMQSTPLVI